MFRVRFSFDLPYMVILSSDKSLNELGWGIIPLDVGGLSYLIDPTPELIRFCRDEDCIVFKSDKCVKETRRYSIGPSRLHLGCYHKQPYIYISDGLLFTMNIDNYAKLVQRLKPKFVLTQKGEILKQSEAFVSALLT